MKCCSCDRILTDYEATRKGALSGAYLDLCNTCIKGLNIATQDREDLEVSTSIHEDPDYMDYHYIVPDEQHNGWLYEDEQ